MQPTIPVNTPGFLILPIYGDEGIRTPGLVDASHALSQLSYIPDKAIPANAGTWIRTKDLSFIRAAL
jgi:hypothetical protein